MSTAPITTSFVHKVRKVAIKENRYDVVADHLLLVVRLIQRGDYNGALAYAKEHGFDLETLRYNARSGVLASQWHQMAGSMKKWGTQPMFLNVEKPLYEPDETVGVPKRRKFSTDTPYRH